MIDVSDVNNSNKKANIRSKSNNNDNQKSK